MRISKKQIKKRNTRIKIKTNKQNKTRKTKGGYTDENGFTLVGFINDTPSHIQGPFIPIFLFNDMEYNMTTYRNKFASFTPANTNGFRFSHIILPQLYKLKKIRGLNLLRSLRNNIYFYDENGNPIMNNKFIPPENTVVQTFWDQPIYKNVIREVELKYPGLFTRVYVTPEEEEQSLREIERKEQEKANSKISEKQEFQEIKQLLKDMQRKELEQSQIPPLRKIKRTLEKRIPETTLVPRVL